MTVDVASRLAAAQVALENATAALDGAQRQAASAERRVHAALAAVREVREAARDGRLLRGTETLAQSTPDRSAP